jgi:mono/diheme cytochrome c family protein
MLGSVPSLQKNHGTPLQSRKAMLETLCRHLDMVRLSAAGVLMISLLGCMGLVDGGSDGFTQQQKDAREKWVNDALPVLRTNCMTCHNGSRANVGFLVGEEDFAIRETLINFNPPVVNLESASISRILTKGLHDGPQLSAEQSSALLLWLQAERQSANHDPDHPIIQIATPKFNIMPCTAGDPDNAGGTCPTNHISLEKVPTDGNMLPGAELTFVAQPLQSGLYLTRFNVVGGTTGVYLEHMLFVSLPAMTDPFPDQIDRYFALKMNVPANMSGSVGGGTESFFGFVGTDQIEVHFKKISKYQADSGMPADNNGCKVLANFKTNAVTQLNANCASCHAGANAGATGAMDLTTVTSTDDAKVLNTCNQVRSRINFQTTDQSGFYLAPNPGSGTNHPFKFPTAAAFTTFKTAMDLWVKAEQTAP